MSAYKFATALAFGLAIATPAGAANFPNRPITLIVPWVGGTSTDIHLRALANRAEKRLKQPDVTDLKPGAAGTLGPATMAASAKPDAYTISQIPVTAGGPAALPQVERKNARIPVVWSKNRAKRAPNVPTLVETGHKIVSDSPCGIGGPKGMDPAVVKILHDSFKDSLDDPVHVNALEQLNQKVIHLNSDDYKAFAINTTTEQAELIKKLGLGEKK